MGGRAERPNRRERESGGGGRGERDIRARALLRTGVNPDPSNDCIRKIRCQSSSPVPCCLFFWSPRGSPCCGLRRWHLSRSRTGRGAIFSPAPRGAGEGAERPSRATVLPLGTQHLPCLNCFHSEGHWGPRQRPEGGQDLARTAQPCVRTAISTVTTRNKQAQGAATHGEKFAKDKHVSGRN